MTQIAIPSQIHLPQMEVYSILGSVASRYMDLTRHIVSQFKRTAHKKSKRNQEYENLSNLPPEMEGLGSDYIA